MHTLTVLACAVGASVLALLAILCLLMVCGLIDMLRARFPKLDKHLYDETHRFNKKFGWK